MTVDLKNLGGHLAKLTWIATRSFFGTLLFFGVLGGGLAVVSGYYLRDAAWYLLVAGVVLALIESGVAGVMLASKRAVAMPIAHGLGSLGLGRSIVSLVFDRFHKGEDRPREMSPAEAERQVNEATEEVEAEDAKNQWFFRRKIVGRIIDAVRRRTVDRFQEEGSRDGKIDVQKVRTELERTIDETLVDKVKGKIQMVTYLAAVALPLLVAIQTWLLLHFDKR